MTDFIPIEQRLFRRRDIPEGGDCWIWIGQANNAGYGQMRVNDKTVYVHRVAYEHYIGPIPSGYQVDHLCNEKLCFNPKHLEAITQRENIERSNVLWALMARTGKCKRGHEMTEENTYIRPDGTGYRNCKTCIRLRKKDWRNE